MTDSETKIRRYVASELLAGRDESSIQMDESLFIDSVGLIELVSFLETEFGVELGRADMARENFASVRAMANLVRQKATASDAS